MMMNTPHTALQTATDGAEFSSATTKSGLKRAKHSDVWSPALQCEQTPLCDFPKSHPKPQIHNHNCPYTGEDTQAKGRFTLCDNRHGNAE